MQGNGERLDHRTQAIIRFSSQRVALIGAHGNKFRKRSVGWWPGAGTAQHDDVPAEV